MRPVRREHHPYPAGAYSPELNPVENIWEYLRKNKLATRLYEANEDIVEACRDAWSSLIAAARSQGVYRRKRFGLKRVPRRGHTEALREKINQHARFRGEIAIGRVERINPCFGRLEIVQHDPKMPSFDVRSGHEGREKDDALSGEASRKEHVSVIG
jgi:hypothetical protein